MTKMLRDQIWDVVDRPPIYCCALLCSCLGGVKSNDNPLYIPCLCVIGVGPVAPVTVKIFQSIMILDGHSFIFFPVQMYLLTFHLSGLVLSLQSKC